MVVYTLRVFIYRVGLLVSDRFLKFVQEEECSVRVFLKSGETLIGVVQSFDQQTVRLKAAFRMNIQRSSVAKINIKAF